MTATWTIALFAGLAERLDARAVTADWAEAELPAARVRQRLIELYPAHAALLEVSFLACNRKYVDDSATVRRSDELALLPPVSGGDGAAETAGRTAGGAILERRYEITDRPLDVGRAIAQVAHPDHGAAVVFVGTTREWTDGQRTVTLEYEAYIPMAVAAMRQIGDEIAAGWPGTLTAIAHRIGTVGIGESSVVIAVSSPHRAEAYDASRYAIERLKAIVPIWKKEVYADGAAWKGQPAGAGGWNPLASAEKTP